MLFVSKSKYNSLLKNNTDLSCQLTRQIVENSRLKSFHTEEITELVKMRECALEEVEKYKKLYLDELQKRLELAKLIKEREVKKWR
jgi:uncharacterized Fe-S cluster-containing protein